MATLKQRLHRKNADGGYDVVHLETSASVVMRADGSTSVEQSLTEIESWDLLKYEEAGDYTGMPYINESIPAHQHVVADITDFPTFPTSLPASDVYSWAKAASKPTYTYSEVGAAAANHTHDNFATKDWCEQIIGASTNGYVYNYTASWDAATRSFIVPSGTVATYADVAATYVLPYSSILEFEPIKVAISANITITVTLLECTNMPSLSSGTKTVTLDGVEINANGSESFHGVYPVDMTGFRVGFSMTTTDLIMKIGIHSTGTNGGVGTTFKYQLDAGNANITAKFMR